MKNLAFHSLLRLKDDSCTSSHYLTYAFERMYFLSLGLKGLKGRRMYFLNLEVNRLDSRLSSLIWLSPASNSGNIFITGTICNTKQKQGLINPFTPESDQCQNSLAAPPEIWHHSSMENLTFHSLLRCKVIILQILATSLIQSLFERLGEYTFWASLGQWQIFLSDKQISFITFLMGKHGKKNSWLIWLFVKPWKTK